MAARIAAASLIVCSGQLIPLQIDELKEMVGAKAPTPDRETSPGFVHPTICDNSTAQTAGYIKAANGINAPNYFFWLVESKSAPATDPLLMWLSGGPGCSSQLALFAENGPCTINSDGATTTLNPYSWNAKANVIWVDQPAGVGFSSGLGTHNEEGVASNMHTFLQGFYAEFPKYQDVPFYIFGESYAGHYVPAIAHKIWEENKAGNALNIPMAGIAVGNGLTHPEEQYKWYAEMGGDGGQSEGGHAPGVFNQATVTAMNLAMPACTAAIHQCNSNTANATACLAASEGCNLITQIPYRLTGKNPYDMRIPCEHGNLCYDFSMVETYLNSDSVKADLGVNGKWESCNMAVNLLFQTAGDWMHNFHMKIPELLHDGIEVLIYAGDVDFICNWLGNKAWTKKLEWDKKDDFNNAADEEWQINGETVAKLRSADNFHFMQVYEAGHMVPMDKPAESLAMVNAFISGSLASHVKANSVVV